jgi:hypothetical protein
LDPGFASEEIDEWACCIQPRQILSAKAIDDQLEKFRHEPRGSVRPIE